jgi:ssDNA-binding Zn-finger/Zn-ribbon topoisomerase 1
MKKTFFILFGLLLTFPSAFGQLKAGKKDTTTHISLYTCAKHPGIVTDKAGKCPVCGMDLNLSKKELLKSDVTKAYTCPIHVDMTSDKPGKCPKCGSQLNLSLKEKMKADVVGIYTCPMHPDVTSSKPGKCPKCGMELEKKHN